MVFGVDKVLFHEPFLSNGFHWTLFIEWVISVAFFEKNKYVLIILKTTQKEFHSFIVCLWINAAQTIFDVNKYADLPSSAYSTLHERTIVWNRKSGTGDSIRTLAQLLNVLCYCTHNPVYPCVCFLELMKWFTLLTHTHTVSVLAGAFIRGCNLGMFDN